MEVVCGATTGATASRCDIRACVDWGGETNGNVNFAAVDGGSSEEKVDKNDVNDVGGEIENFENNDGDNVDISSEVGEVEYKSWS
jgi:hypothetical protein